MDCLVNDLTFTQIFHNFVANLWDFTCVDFNCPFWRNEGNFIDVMKYLCLEELGLKALIPLDKSAKEKKG